MTYQEGYDLINNKYDKLKEEIEAKNITIEYTKKDKEAELAANEEARKAALEQYDNDFKATMDNIQNVKNGINYDYIMKQIEDVDFPAPDPLDVEEENTEKIMQVLPSTVNNTKYIYLTFDNKYLALNDMATSEHEKYTKSYDEIQDKYNDLETEINNKYDELITEINTKYDALIGIDPDVEEKRTNELTENEELRTTELEENEAKRKEEIKPLNEDYLLTMTTIATALTDLKTDKETGFIGDVHINGKLHVDTDINLEGSLNNIPITDYLTKTDMESIKSTQDLITESLANKADSEHEHTISEIIDYEAYDDTEIKTMIATKPTVKQYDTFDDMISDWLNIPDNSICVTPDGPTSYPASFTFKYNNNRSLTFNIPKKEDDYIYTRFQGESELTNQWKKHPSNWRKIPVLTDEDNLIANNVKADNETRLVAVEQTLTTHTHKSSDIVFDSNIIFTDSGTNTREIRLIAGKDDCGRIAVGATATNAGWMEIATADDLTEPIYVRQYKYANGNYFDHVGREAVLLDTLGNTSFPGVLTASNIKADNEIRLKAAEDNIKEKADSSHTHTITDITNLQTTLNNKSETGHTHTITDITDYKPYDDTEIKNALASKANATHVHAISDITNLQTTLNNKSETGHTHTITDITDYKAYDDTEIKNTLASKADSSHTHTISEITDYKAYDDTYIKNTLASKANATHMHAISDITNLQTSLDSKASNTEFNKINNTIRTYKIRNNYRTQTAGKPLVFIKLGYIKNYQTTYKGFMAKFSLNCVASNNAENSVFETDEICIGHVMEGSVSSITKIGISSCYRKIGNEGRSLGIGLVDVNGDNSIYRVDLIISGYNGWYRTVYNIIIDMDVNIRLYTDSECTTALDVVSYLGGYNSISDYSEYQSYAMAETIYSSIGHTHTISDITDLQTTLNGKADNNHKHNSSDITFNSNIIFTDSGTNIREIRFIAGTNDSGRIAVGATATNAGWMEIATADDLTEPIYVRQYKGGGGNYYNSISREAVLLDASGNTSFPGTLTASNIKTDNETRLATAESNITTNANNIAALQTKINSLESTITTLTNQVNTLASVIKRQIIFTNTPEHKAQIGTDMNAAFGWGTDWNGMSTSRGQEIWIDDLRAYC